MPMLTRERLAGLRRARLHDGRNATKGTVDRIEVDGRQVVVKDLQSRSWPVRRILGPWQLDREESAYRRLAGVPGVPQFLGRLDRQAIALEFVAGRTLASVRPGDLQEAFFDRLDHLIHTLHDRGVAHGDLHHRDILVTSEGQPYVVDFSTSIAVGSPPGLVDRLLFSQMRRADLRAAARLRCRLVPGSRAEVPGRPLLYRAGAVLKRLHRFLSGEGADR